MQTVQLTFIFTPTSHISLPQKTPDLTDYKELTALSVKVHSVHTSIFSLVGVYKSHSMLLTSSGFKSKEWRGSYYNTNNVLDDFGNKNIVSLVPNEARETSPGCSNSYDKLQFILQLCKCGLYRFFTEVIGRHETELSESLAIHVV